MDHDLINGLFECGAGLFLLMNVVRLHRDKKVRGVSIVPIAFMVAWGYWNLYFYPTVSCDMSFYGGLVVVAVNTVWVGQMIYYKRKERR